MRRTVSKLVIFEVGFVVPVLVTVPSKKATPAIGIELVSKRPPLDWKTIPGQVMSILFVFGGIRIFAVTEIIFVVVLVFKYFGRKEIP